MGQTQTYHPTANSPPVSFATLKRVESSFDFVMWVDSTGKKYEERLVPLGGERCLEEQLEVYNLRRHQELFLVTVYLVEPSGRQK